MPDFKLTKARLSNHLRYGKWVYLLIALVAFFTVDLLYTMTEYRAPGERRVDIELVQPGYMDTDALTALEAEALLRGQAHDSALEVVDFVHIAYSGDPNTDMYGAQKFGVMLSANEGDVWVLPRALFDDLHREGALLPLDSFVAQGVLRLGGADLTAFTLPGASDETDADGVPLPPDGPIALYGFPAEQLRALSGAGYVLDGNCVAVMRYSANPETAVAVLQAIVDAEVAK